MKSQDLRVTIKTDRYGRRWRLRRRELCPGCGQPDNCGDCTHEKISAREAMALGALPQERKAS